MVNISVKTHILYSFYWEWSHPSVVFPAAAKNTQDRKALSWRSKILEELHIQTFVMEGEDNKQYVTLRRGEHNAVKWGKKWNHFGFSDLKLKYTIQQTTKCMFNLLGSRFYTRNWYTFSHLQKSFIMLWWEWKHEYLTHHNSYTYSFILIKLFS